MEVVGMAASFSDSIDSFVKASDWLTDVHLPAVVALRAIAAQLDAGDLAPPLLGQFGLTYRALMKEAPKVDGEVDALEAALGVAGDG